MTYFENEAYVSNSELGEFDRIFNARPEITTAERKQQIYDFGNLFEQTAGVDEMNHKFASSFDAATLEKARLMDLALKNDPSLGSVFNHMKKQPEFYVDDFEVEYYGEIIHLPVKCKLDGILHSISMAADLKSTACANQQQFLAAAKHFKYFRQAAWYMDIAKIDKMLFIGVGKTQRRGVHPVFCIAIRRGDENYLLGKAQYSYLAYRYFHYIHCLDLSNYKLAA